MKQVIVIRKDLNMRKGKMVAQGAHASLAVFFNRISINSRPNELRIDINKEEWNWINGIFTKICVSVNSKEELISIYHKARSLNIPSSLIIDSGKTEFNGVATPTAVGILGEDHIVNSITGDLPLL